MVSEISKVNVGVTLNSTVNVFNQQDIRVVLIQNFAWPTALYLNRPNIFVVIILGTMMKPLPHSRQGKNGDGSIFAVCG